MTDIDDSTIREQTRNIILDHAKDIEYLSIGEMIADLDEFSGLPQDEFDRVQGRIDKMIRNAAVTVALPGDPDPNEALNVAYRERAHLVALLAAVYPSQLRENPDPDYPDWPIVYIQTPTGQMSWHLSPADVELFPHVKFGTDAEWDGHSTEEKYARMRHLTAQTAAAAKHGAENAQALDELRRATRRFLAAHGGEPQ